MKNFIKALIFVLLIFVAVAILITTQYFLIPGMLVLIFICVLGIFLK